MTRAGEKQQVTYEFDPDYVVPTSEVLREWLDYNGVTTHVAAAARYARGEPRSWAATVLNGVLNGQALTDTSIEVLEAVTGISASFWSAFERNFRVGIAAGKLPIRD